jgi:hypothetical protein
MESFPTQSIVWDLFLGFYFGGMERFPFYFENRG